MFRTKTGFSLLEILIVMSLLAILGLFVAPTMQLWKFNTYKTLAKSNLRSIKTLAEAYKIDNMTNINPADCEETTTDGQYTYCTLTSGDSNVENPLGFALKNADQQKFTYKFAVLTDNVDLGWSAVATLRDDISCPGSELHQFFINSCGRFCTTKELDTKKCISSVEECGNIIDEC